MCKLVLKCLQIFEKLLKCQKLCGISCIFTIVHTISHFYKFYTKFTCHSFCNFLNEFILETYTILKVIYIVKYFRLDHGHKVGGNDSQEFHQYYVWSRNYTWVFFSPNGITWHLSWKDFFLTDILTDQKIPFNMAEFVVICILAAKYVIELAWTLLQLLSPIGSTTVSQASM